jgi:hypothetical protein
MSEPVSIFGYQVSQGAFQLLLEGVKALVFGVIAAYLVYRLNQNAKCREQDDALYNELVKPRILAVNDLNARLSALAAEYLRVLDEFEKNPLDDLEPPATGVPRSSQIEYRQNEIHMEADEAVRRFRKQLPGRAAELMVKADEVRYVIGEVQYGEFQQRVQVFSRNITLVWGYFEGSLIPRIMQAWNQADTPAELRTETPRSIDQLIRTRKAVAVVARRRINRFLRVISSDFDIVLRTKGQSTLELTTPPQKTLLEMIEERSKRFGDATADRIEQEMEEAVGATNK